MRPHLPRLVGARLAFAAALAGLAFAAAPPQVPPSCKLDAASTSQLRIYECQEQLRIAAEAATRISAIQRGGRLVGVKIEGGAVLVEATKRSESFEIVTPQAVTQAQDGRVAVDATQAGTAVFVREGEAKVTRDGGSVSLRPGEGVDVAALRTRSVKPSSLDVKSWGAERASRLMGRLGG